MKTLLGIDYGTQSARAVLADSADGKVLFTHSVKYPHGVMTGDLASIDDYRNVLNELMEAAFSCRYADSILGICVDATSLTLVPMDSKGNVLCDLPELSSDIHSQVKLWKRHTAKPQADEALALAREMGEKFPELTGGTISAEWMLPKLMEIRDESPKAWEKLDIAFDLPEYITYLLTGEMNRSVSSMGFKCSWSEDGGLPGKDYLDRLRPGFGDEYHHLLRGKVLKTGEKAGMLTDAWKKKLGITRDVTVAAGVIDGHPPLAVLGATRRGDASFVIGTSTVMAILTDTPVVIPGITGIVKDGIVKGAYAIECGQNCVGDMLEWFVTNAVPGEYKADAEKQGMNIHQYLCEKISQPWNSSLVVTDWFGGSRNFPCDLTLPGTIVGLTMQTKPEDIYLALLQAIVCGVAEIVDGCAAAGVRINRLLVTGGIAMKNPLLMNILANVLSMDIQAGRITEGPAAGSAVYAAVAAGIYPDIDTACQSMSVKDFITYSPDPNYSNEYALMKKKNHLLRLAIENWNKAAGSTSVL